jgi:CBS domain-containing protein
MTINNLKTLPVMEKDRLVGVVSFTDIAFKAPTLLFAAGRILPHLSVDLSHICRNTFLFTGSLVGFGFPSPSQLDKNTLNKPMLFERS